MESNDSLQQFWKSLLKFSESSKATCQIELTKYLSIFAASGDIHNMGNSQRLPFNVVTHEGPKLLTKNITHSNSIPLKLLLRLFLRHY